MRALQVFLALTLALLLAAPTGRADPGPDDAALAAFHVLAAAAENAALSMAGTAVTLAQNFARIADNFGPAVSQPVNAALGAAQGSQRMAQNEFLAAGKGDALVSTSSTTSCRGMMVQVEMHEALSEEPILFVNFLGGPDSPSTLCASGWRAGFTRDEVQGDADQGWTIEERDDQLDAIIHATIGPLRADGTRSLTWHQITYPSDIHQTFEFSGSITEVA